MGRCNCLKEGMLKEWEAVSLRNLMAHVEEKACKDVQVQRHNVSQRQNQHHHVDQMTWKANRNT